MSKRGVLLLGLVAALLLAYVLAFERTSLTSKELGARKGKVLESFVRDKVEKLELTWQGRRIVLEKKPLDEGELRGWRMVAPVASEADEDVVDQVLGELEWLSARRTIDGISPEDEERFGLAGPRYRVAYTAAGERHVLEVGSEDVHGENVYVRVDGAARAHVVPKSLVEALRREPGEFRDKQLLPELTVDWTQKLVITQAGDQTVLTKEGDRWWLETAPRGLADDARVEALLHTLAGLRATRYLTPDERKAAEQALASPSLRLEANVIPDVSREDKSPKALGLEAAGACGPHTGERYARAQPGGSPVCVREDDLKALSPSPSELRDHRLLDTDVSAIERFELARGDSKLALARDGTGWKVTTGDAKAISAEAVEGWLKELAAARATRVVSPEGFEEQGSLTLTLAGDKRERTAVGKFDAKSEELPVRRGAEPLVAMFPASVFDRLAPAPRRFASLEPWEAHQPSEVQRVTAQSEGQARMLHLEDGSVRAEHGGSVDPGRIRSLVRALLDLRVRSFVSEQARPGHGLGAAETSVRLALAKGEELALELGAPTSAGAYARIDGAYVVEVGRDVIGIVRELAGGPRAPLAAPAAGQPGHEPPLEDEGDGEDHGDHEGAGEHEHAH